MLHKKFGNMEKFCVFCPRLIVLFFMFFCLHSLIVNYIRSTAYALYMAPLHTHTIYKQLLLYVYSYVYVRFMFFTFDKKVKELQYRVYELWFMTVIRRHDLCLEFFTVTEARNCKKKYFYYLEIYSNSYLGVIWVKTIFFL